jgi:hypothetical protein
MTAFAHLQMTARTHLQMTAFARLVAARNFARGGGKIPPVSGRRS